MAPPKYSIIIPAYNEEGNLQELVGDIKAALKLDEYEIILVDDNSSDGTPGICDELSRQNKGVNAIHRQKGKNGMGYALIEGTSSALGRYVVWVMGDRSDKLECIRDIVAKLDGGYDLVMASRYMKGGSRGELEADKALYGSSYTTLARAVFGLPVHDITNAFRGFRKEVFEKARPQSGDFAISPEFAIKAHLAGFRLAEVPTIYFNRRAGQTKFRIFQMGIRYLSLFWLRLAFKKT